MNSHKIRERNRYLSTLNEQELDERLKYLKSNFLDENDESEIREIEHRLDSWWRREGIL